MIRPAASSTSRCWEMACREEVSRCFMASRTQISNRVWSSRSASSSRIFRRVGSASAWYTSPTTASICKPLLACRLGGGRRVPARNAEVFCRIHERHLLHLRPVRVGDEHVGTAGRELSGERDLAVGASYRRPGRSGECGSGQGG